MNPTAPNYTARALLLVFVGLLSVAAVGALALTSRPVQYVAPVPVALTATEAYAELVDDAQTRIAFDVTNVSAGAYRVDVRDMTVLDDKGAIYSPDNDSQTFLAPGASTPVEILVELPHGRAARVVTVVAGGDVVVVPVR